MAASGVSGTSGASTRPSQNSDAIIGGAYLLPTSADDAVHAPTIAATGDGLVAAWYEGTRERSPDVVIRVARHRGSGWSRSSVVATGRRPDGTEVPTWNPVLFEPEGGPLLLFYKVGERTRSWRGAARISEDGGATWSAEIPLPEGRIGPTRAKPVQLADGSLLIGSSTEGLGGWDVHLERLSPYGPPDRGVYSLWEEPPGEPVRDGEWNEELLADPGAWTRTRSLPSESRLDAIQPTLLVHSDQRIRLLARTRRSGFVFQSLSGDGGDTWTKLRKTTLPNPDAGIDSLRLADGRFLLAYNPVREGRERLGIAVSDDGEDWRYALDLENGDGSYSYPALVQAEDGRVHVLYTWKRERIRHVVLDPDEIR